MSYIPYTSKSERKAIARAAIMNRGAIPPSKCIPLAITSGSPTVQEKEDTMYSNTAATSLTVNANAPLTTEQGQISYLVSQAKTARREKTIELAKKFGLEDDKYPRTANDLIARIKDGQFITDPFTADMETCCPLDSIRFRDPTKLPDEAGFEAAKSLLDKAYTDAERAILVSSTGDDLKAGIKLIEGIESFQPAA